MKRAQSVQTWDKFWARQRSSSIYPPVTDIPRELSSVTPLHNKKILEVGAGTGRDSMKMSAAGASVYILDYSGESLKLVRSFMTEHSATLVLADARNCPFPDESFDVIFHQGLLEHFTSPFPLLYENHRLLKHNGLLVVDVPQTFHIYTIMKHTLILIGKWFGGWERQFTISSLSRLLVQTGFKPVHVYGDWSRPGVFYKILRKGLEKLGIGLPMMPHYVDPLTKKFYGLQERLRKKKLLLYTVLSIGIIARKR